MTVEKLKSWRFLNVSSLMTSSLHIQFLTAVPFLFSYTKPISTIPFSVKWVIFEWFKVHDSFFLGKIFCMSNRLYSVFSFRPASNSEFIVPYATNLWNTVGIHTSLILTAIWNMKAIVTHFMQVCVLSSVLVNFGAHTWLHRCSASKESNNRLDVTLPISQFFD